MNVCDVKDILRQADALIGSRATVQGWIRNHRKQRSFGFIDFFDGTALASLQIVYTEENKDFAFIQTLRPGCAIQATGTLVAGNHGGIEMNAEDVVLIGDCPEDYPLQPKKHSIEFLREIAYLRPRTRLFQAVFRVRSVAAQAIHEYFQSRGYVYVHTPLISANDAEGAGNTFTVTTFDLARSKAEKDYSGDFFGKQTSLAVTGQLEGETFAMAFKRIYTFGPTFRAENSNTKTHAAEFWMIEPEIAFCDLNGLMDIEEDFLKSVVSYVMEHAPEELKFLDGFTKSGLIEKLTALVNSHVVRLSHHDAIKALIESGVDFEFKPAYGEDLAKEHEKYLTDVLCKSPVFIYDWPKDIKAFYMKQNPDGKTAAAVDLLVPTAGELMGGSQREESYDKLLTRMRELHISDEDMYWYLNLRKYGGCPHAGFGMGFERLIIYLTGVDNIRDVIPYPRCPGNCEF
ncbi:MAG: asparagine--tRNA ligase [Eubacteriales bacterium]|nr:asparagine--tRNA ligase [Eubacteriales bacterium]